MNWRNGPDQNAGNIGEFLVLNCSQIKFSKYDKCALEKAVLSVRKGEMSVHRAGSFYGVPHSTLEYKVKERNLLRGKRRFNGDKKADDEDQDVLQKALSMNSLESVENQCSSDVKSECDA